MAKSPRAPSSPNQNLANAQKQQVLAHYNAQRSLNPSYHQKDLANWIRDTFSLSYTPSRSTIHRILHQSKKQYRARQYSTALLEAELGSTDIYKMDILSAIRICKQIWDEFSSITIRNCWKHTGLVDWDRDAALDREVLETIRKLTDVGLQDVVEPLEEDVMPETEEEELEGKTPPETPPACLETSEEAITTAEEQLKTLRAAQGILAEYGLLSLPVLKAIESCSSCITNGKT